MTIDLTPTWRGIMPALLAALENGTPEGQRLARLELTRLADNMDALSAMLDGVRAIVRNQADEPYLDLVKIRQLADQTEARTR